MAAKYPGLAGTTFEIRARGARRPDIIGTIAKIAAMPVGKRKYIMLHKHAYDLYNSLEDYDKATVRGTKLYDLMTNLKLKINDNEKLGINYKLYTAGWGAYDDTNTVRGVYAGSIYAGKYPHKSRGK